MKVTTSRAFRAQHLYDYRPDDFENFADYFFYLHLNHHVQWIHVIGAVGGALLFPITLWLAYTQHQFVPFILAAALYYGAGFASHWTGDGIVSKTAASFWASYACVLKLIGQILTGKISQAEQAFMKKYPQVMWVYLADAPQPDKLPQPATASQGLSSTAV